MHRKARQIATIEPQDGRTIVSGSQVDARQAHGGIGNRAKGLESNWQILSP